MTTLKLTLPSSEYNITVGKGILKKADEYFNLARKVFIITDSGVPKEYSATVKSLCKDATVFTVREGEDSKSLSVMEEICKAMLDFGITRTDCVVAVGGGVVGDLSGFCAASYMRGVDFYNIPTTLLSQVDSSIGGKTAVNLGSVKNIVGAFHQPKGVLIDTDVLKSLPKRHFSAGLAEAIKMSLTSDEELFRFFEENEINDENIEKVIVDSLKIKRYVVQQDEKESGLRKILNFGHTLGHGIETEAALGGLYHGECVALGMIPMCSIAVSDRLIKVLKKFNLPTEYRGDISTALKYVAHDKKASSNKISVIFVDNVGTYRISSYTMAELSEYLSNFYTKKG